MRRGRGDFNRGREGLRSAFWRLNSTRLPQGELDQVTPCPPSLSLQPPLHPTTPSFSYSVVALKLEMVTHFIKQLDRI